MELVELVAGILFYFFPEFVAGNVLVVGQVFVVGFWFQSVVGSLFFVLFFSAPVIVESPRSLLLFKLNVASIASGCSICVFLFWGRDVDDSLEGVFIGVTFLVGDDLLGNFLFFSSVFFFYRSCS